MKPLFVPWYSWDGTPCSMDEFTAQRQSRHLVLRTWVNEFMVSTVHLGMDHSFGMGPPLIFETMVFDQHPSMESKFSDEITNRYPTVDAAVAGHFEAVVYMRHHPTSIEGEPFELTTTPERLLLADGGLWQSKCSCGYVSGYLADEFSDAATQDHMESHWAKTGVS